MGVLGLRWNKTSLWKTEESLVIVCLGEDIPFPVKSTGVDRSARKQTSHAN